MKFMNVEVVPHDKGFTMVDDARRWVKTMRRRKIKLIEVRLHPLLVQYLMSGQGPLRFRGLLSFGGFV